MLNKLFSIEDIRYKNLVYGKKDNLEFLFKNYLSFLKSYYYKCNLYVRRPNVLVTLIETLDINLFDSYTSVYLELDDKSEYVSRTLGLVNSSNINIETFDNTIFDNVDEHILYIEERFDYTTIEECKNSLTCLYNNKNDIQLVHPKRATYKDGLFIYSLNTTKLGMQYYYWANEQLKLDLDIDAARFVYEIVLTDVIDSVIDISLFNRYIDIYNNIPVTKYINNNPMTIIDLSKKIDDMYKWIITKNKIDGVLLSQYTHNIPLLIKNNLNDILELPYIFVTKQNEWFLWVSRIKYLMFFLNVLDSKRNKYFINKLKVVISYSEKDKRFNLGNTNPIIKDLNIDINKIKKIMEVI